MQNADLTWVEDLGSVTELLSGEFFRWLGRSSSHQLWSSAMVISPALRGLFGLQWNAAGNTLSVSPALPAQWNEAQVSGVPLGNKRADLSMRREGQSLFVQIRGEGTDSITLASPTPGTKREKGGLRIPLPPVEIGIGHGLPNAGAVTCQIKVLSQRYSEKSFQLRLSAPAGTQQTLFWRANNPKLRVWIDGANFSPGSDQFHVQFPRGSGYTVQTVTAHW
jgi:hypothetical protein